jgi:hypothetical protein
MYNKLLITNQGVMVLSERLLDDMDIIVLGNNHERSQWIHEQKDKDLYSLGQWLMINLTPQRTERDHLRSDLRILLNKWNGESWTEKQKHYLGHSLIAFWPARQLDKDPRYQL